MVWPSALTARVMHEEHRPAVHDDGAGAAGAAVAKGLDFEETHHVVQ